MTTLQIESAIVLDVPSKVTDLATRNALKEEFAPFYQIVAEQGRDALSIVVTDPSQKEVIEAAHEKRMALRKARVEAEKTRKRLKADSLTKGQAIDEMYNRLEAVVEPLERHLLDQEQFAERAEAERKARIKAEREKRLAELDIDASLYNVSEMTDIAFDKMVEDAQLAKQARAEAARKAEEQRIAQAKADAEERERVRKENDKLKAEAAEREKAMQAEREAAEIARKSAEAKARKEREAIEAKARAEREAAEAVARKEREAREKLEREQREREAAERKKKDDEAKAAAKAARAPDKKKVLDFAAQLGELEFPEVKSDEANALRRAWVTRVSEMVKWLESQATSL